MSTDVVDTSQVPDGPRSPATRDTMVIRLPWWLLPGVLIVGAWSGLLWTAMHLTVDDALHRVALFVHLSSLVVAFGAVLTVDFQAAMMLLGRRRMPDVLRSAQTTHALIWAGLGGLMLSGVALRPNFDSTLTQVKMVLVLVAALNGLAALGLQRRLSRLAGRPPGGRLMIQATVATTLSQLAWWGAVFIGFVNNQYEPAAAVDPMSQQAVMDPVVVNEQAAPAPPSTEGLPGPAGPPAPPPVELDQPQMGGTGQLGGMQGD